MKAWLCSLLIISTVIKAANANFNAQLSSTNLKSFREKCGLCIVSNLHSKSCVFHECFFLFSVFNFFSRGGLKCAIQSQICPQPAQDLQLSRENHICLDENQSILCNQIHWHQEIRSRPHYLTRNPILVFLKKIHASSCMLNNVVLRILF